MRTDEGFRPDWASMPADTISDILEERGLSTSRFAELIGVTSTFASELIAGRTTITIDVARRLETAFGASVEFWISRDYEYRQDDARLNEMTKTWIRQLPLKDMIKFGWIPSMPSASEEAETFLDFFNVPSVSAWHEKYVKLEQNVAFRSSGAHASEPVAVSAWLRQGEIQSESIPCQRWNADGFRKSLGSIRALTWQKDPVKFLPELQKICSQNGVAVSIVRAPSGCRASGAAQFVTVEKALISLSFRYLTDDHFWFSFFHEAGHLLLHDSSELFLEGEFTTSNMQEEEANNFAHHVLIPNEFQAAFLALRGNYRDVMRFATRAGVSPGIVVGQLQHLGLIGFDQLNKLKRSYRWEE